LEVAVNQDGKQVLALEVQDGLGKLSIDRHGVFFDRVHAYCEFK
jgi:hypothetical protein